MRILVIGGTGFIGRRLVARLSGGGQHQILVPTRSYGRGRDLQILPGVTLTADDVHDDATLDRLLRGCDAAVNLVGILHGKAGKPYGLRFRPCARDVAAAGGAGLPAAGRATPAAHERAGRRFRRRQHVPALQGRRQGRRAQELEGWRDGGWTIFRPSVVFGPDDNFTNLFARLARWLPVLPLARRARAHAAGLCGRRGGRDDGGAGRHARLRQDL